jgi:hypothetical protein
MWTLLLACREPIDGAGPTIFDLRVDETDIPRVLRVSFVTEVDATGAVAFGPAGGPPVLEVTDGGGTDHELLVAGLAPGTRVRLLPSATGPGGTTTAPETLVDVPALADDDPRPEVLVPADPRSAGGWTLLDVNRNGTGTLQVLLVDPDGAVVWQYDPSRGEDVGAVDVQVTDAGAVLVAGSVPEGERPVELSLDGVVRWEGPEQPRFEDDGFMHHHTDPTPDGGHVYLEKDVRGGRRGDRVVVRGPDGAARWSWSTWDHWEVPPTGEEWTHLNWVDLRDDVFYLSDQHSSRIWKIDRATGEPVWSLGAGGDFTLTSGTWFAGQHAPEWGPDGRLWVYDNGRGSGRSRVVAYVLDEDARTATQDAEWDGGAEWGWYTGYWGDVDVLPNGNLLVGAGNPDARRVMEVDPSTGDVVAALALPPPFAFYRASRVDPVRWRIRALAPSTE